MQAGDPETQRDFWKQTYGDVYAISSRILGTGSDAGEVAVDVLSDFLLRYVHSISNEQTLISYLRIMTTRRALKYRAKKRPYTPLDIVDLADEDTKNPEEAAYLASLMPRLEECMEQLTPKAQQVIRLRYFRHMTNQSIGEWVGGSKQYIGRLVTQSIEALKNCLNTSTRTPIPSKRGGKR